MSFPANWPLGAEEFAAKRKRLLGEQIVAVLKQRSGPASSHSGIEGVTGLLCRAKISPMTRRAAHETTETEPRCRVQGTGGARGIAG